MQTPLNFLLLICCCLLPVFVHAEIYKWVDENGRTHYGDRPHVNSESVNVRERPQQPNVKVPADRLEKQQRFLRARKIERAKKQQAEAKEKHQAAKRKRNCEYARRELHRQQTATGLYRTNEKGERVYLSFEERARAEAKARSNIKKWCK